VSSRPAQTLLIYIYPLILLSVGQKALGVASKTGGWRPQRVGTRGGARKFMPATMAMTPS
jgi:hypothetical protein